jgi:hypothetical protein
MPSPKVAALNRQDIATTAKTFQWNRQIPKWSVIVEGRELPARPLVLEAAGVPPNDPTNSHQAVALLQQQGFEVRYQGKTIQGEQPKQSSPPAIDDLIHKLRGSLKGPHSLLEDREHEHRIEKDRFPR